MADKILLEDGTSKLLLEDGTSFLLLEAVSGQPWFIYQQTSSEVEVQEVYPRPDHSLLHEFRSVTTSVAGQPWAVLWNKTGPSQGTFDTSFAGMLSILTFKSQSETTPPGPVLPGQPWYFYPPPIPRLQLEAYKVTPNHEVTHFMRRRAVVPVSAFAVETVELNDPRWAEPWRNATPHDLFLFRRYPSAGSYSLTASAGTYTLTGQSTILAVSRRITAVQGSYSLTGQGAGLRAGRNIAAAQGAYALTGQAQGLRTARTVVSSQGSYTLNGQNVTLTYTPSSGPYILVASQGQYSLTGQSATLAGPNRGNRTHPGWQLKIHKVFVVSATGKEKWRDYIPVQQVVATGEGIGRYNNNGAVELQVLGSNTGLTEWVDYVPVVLVGNTDATRWREDMTGWLPFIVIS